MFHLGEIGAASSRPPRAVGAGEHRTLQASPYVFARSLTMSERTDQVVVALDQGTGAKTIPVADVFADGARVVDTVVPACPARCAALSC